MSDSIVYHGALLDCVDGHWRDIALAVTRRLAGGHRIDGPYARPGGTLRHKDDCQFTDVVVKDITEVSIALHGALQLFLAHHQNCGAYGGSQAFASLAEERAVHTADLLKAQEFFHQGVLVKAEKTLRSGRLFSRQLSVKERGHLEAAVNGGFHVTSLFIPEVNRGEVLSIKLSACREMIVGTTNNAW